MARHKTFTHPLLAELNEILITLEKQYNVRPITLEVSSRYTRAYAKAYSHARRIIFAEWTLEDREAALETLKHEFAHIVAYDYYGRNQGHGANWQRLAIELGVHPSEQKPFAPAQRTGLEMKKMASHLARKGSFSVAIANLEGGFRVLASGLSKKEARKQARKVSHNYHMDFYILDDRGEVTNYYLA